MADKGGGLGVGWAKQKATGYARPFAKAVAQGAYLAGVLAWTPLLVLPEPYAAWAPYAVGGAVVISEAVHKVKGETPPVTARLLCAAAFAAVLPVRLPHQLAPKLFFGYALFQFASQYGKSKDTAKVIAMMVALVAIGHNYAAALFLYNVHKGKFFMLGVATALLKFLHLGRSTLSTAFSAEENAAAAVLAGLYQLATCAVFNLMAFFPQPMFRTFVGGVFNNGQPSKAVAFWVGRYAARAVARISGTWDTKLLASVPDVFFMSRQEFAIFRTFKPLQSFCIVLGDMLLAGFVFDKNRRAGVVGTLLLGFGLLSAGVVPDLGFWIPGLFCIVSFLASQFAGKGIDKTAMKAKTGLDKFYWYAIGLGTVYKLYATAAFAVPGTQ